MNVSFEKNYLRKAHRISLPAYVMVEGVECRVQDWSLGGFRCECMDESCWPPDWEGRVVFTLPFKDVRISFDATARLMRVAEGSAGFAFLDLPARSKKLMQTYIQASVEGRLGDVDGLLAQMEGLEVPTTTEVPMSDAESAVHSRRFRSRTLAYWGLGLVVVAALGFVLYYNLSFSVSKRGVVSGSLVDKAPEAAGVLLAVLVREGERVTKGQVLFEMDDEDLLRQVERLRLAAAKEREEANLLLVRIAEEERSLGLYRQAAGLEVERLKNEIAGVQARIDLAGLEYSRAEELVGSGAVSRSYFDEKARNLKQARARLGELRERLALAEKNAASAETGLYLSDGRTQGRLKEMQAELKVQESVHKESLERLQQAMADLADVRVPSRVDGVVYSIKQVPGTFLRPGESVLSLWVDTGAAPWVLARYTFEESRRIAPGDPASVFIPALQVRLPGRVQAIGHHAMASGGAVSQDKEISLSEVPVKIILDETPDGLMPGLGAVVEIRTSFAESLLDKLGVR